MAATTLVRNELQLSASVIRSDAELRRLGPEWKELFQRTGCDNLFLSFEWLSAWWFHLGQGYQLFIVAIRDDEGRLAALAPLYISFQIGPLRIRRLGFLGDKLVGSDYLDLIVDVACYAAAVDCICACILGCRQQWDYIQLSDIRADSIAATQFRRTMEGHGLSATMAFSSVCPYEVLPRSTEEYSAKLTSGFRKSLRYYARTLQREGHVEFLTVDHAPDLQGAFDDLRRLHRARFETRRASSAFLQPQAEEFHRAALLSLAEGGWARIHLLKLRGKCIAASYELSSGQRLFFYQTGIDPDYSRFSVGQLLIQFTIERAIQNSCAEFDFLRGNEAYKSKWARDIRKVYNLQFFDGHGKSRIARTAKSILTLLRSCKATLRSLGARPGQE